MDAHTSTDGLLALLEDLKLALPGLPGFRDLSIFGSIAEGRADGWSDVDLMVTTDDLEKAKSSVVGLLERKVGPVEFCWAINLRPDEWNPTIVFSNHGHYHKLDLGLAASDAADRTIPREQTTLLIDVPQPCEAFLAPCTAYCPEAGSVGHFLLSVLISGPRYMKARRRGQPLTCYRFLSAAAELCACALYSRLCGEMSHGWRLSTVEYAALDRLASPEQTAAFLTALDFSSPTAMDHAMYRILCQLCDHAQDLARTRGEDLAQDVIECLLRFMRDETDASSYDHRGEGPQRTTEGDRNASQ